MSYLLLFIPAIFGTAAFITNKFIFKVGQTLSCLVIALYYGLSNEFSTVWFLAIAFALSILGDFFLSFRTKTNNYFILGITAFLFVHVGYILFIYNSFSASLLIFLISLLILLLGYTLYFTKSLYEKLDGVMKVGVMGYIAISCVAFALVVSINAPAVVKTLSVIGIFLIVFSDTIIAESSFAGRRKAVSLILPTYYLAQITLSAMVIYKVLNNL